LDFRINEATAKAVVSDILESWNESGSSKEAVVFAQQLATMYNMPEREYVDRALGTFK